MFFGLRTLLILFFLIQYSIIQSQDLYDQGMFLAKVEQSGKEGYINNFGEIIIPINFDEVGWVNEGKINARIGDDWFTYGLDGKQLLDLGDKFKFVGVWGSDLCLASDDIKYITSEPTNRKKIYLGNKDYRFIDSTGTVVLKLPNELKLSYEFSRHIRFEEDILKISTPVDRRSPNKLIGYLNKSLEIIHPMTLPGCYFGADFQGGRALVPNMQWSQKNLDDVKYGFINKKGKLVIDSVYNHATSFIDGVSVVRTCYTLPAKNKNSKPKQKCNSFIIDKNGNRLFSDSIFTYINTKPIDSTFFVYKLVDEKKKYALAHSSGKLLTEFEYDNVIEPIQGGYYTIKKKGEDSQFMNSGGDLVILDNLLPNFRNFNCGMLITNENNLYRIINMDNEIVLEKEFEYRPFIKTGIIEVRTSGIRDREEKKYDYYSPYGKKLDVERYDNKLRFIWHSKD